MTYEVRAFQTLVAVDFENRIVETRRYLAYGTGLATASGTADPEWVGGAIRNQRTRSLSDVGLNEYCESRAGV